MIQNLKERVVVCVWVLSVEVREVDEHAERQCKLRKRGESQKEFHCTLQVD